MMYMDLVDGSYLKHAQITVYFYCLSSFSIKEEDSQNNGIIYNDSYVKLT